jgi:RNA polymerase sigma-70 factor (ECF subfamily)
MKMKTINLRDFYDWYAQDEFVEVADEVAVELLADKRYEQVHERRMRRNKTYPLDEAADSEAAAFACHSDNPQALLEMKERHCGLCRALNSLPEIQGRRVEARYLLGMSQKEIAEAEGVSEEAVSKAIEKGIAAMKKYLRNFHQGG